MKKILGLDLGSASIGWALVYESYSNETIDTKIVGLGSRIIPYEGTEGKDFAKGTGESRNAVRTKNRTARKGYDRYQLRRKFLTETLLKNDMYPNDTIKAIPKFELWKLRSDCVTSQTSLKELGRILLWLNQKRGYKSSRSDIHLDKKDTEFVAKVKSRHEMIKERGLTIGQYFYQELTKDENFRVKENIFPREAYIEEFDAIWKQQKQHYPILTDCPKAILELIANSLFPGPSQESLRKDSIKGGLFHIIRNQIIYHQRPLKSQKGLVSVCDFEGFWRKGKDGKEYFVGPKVAPKSSPLFQLSKIWENINNIKLSSRTGEEIQLTLDQKWDRLVLSENDIKIQFVSNSQL